MVIASFTGVRSGNLLRRKSGMSVLPVPRSRAHQTWRRHIAALRVHDALALGASIRDIGLLLFGLERIRQEWAGEALKSQCRRLIAQARAMAAGGYRSLLR